MNQKIIFAPGFNEAEILKSLALHGINTIGMRVMNAAELASFALVRSGVHVPEKMLSPQEELVIIADAARSEKYFEKVSYADISDLRAAVRSLRSLVTEDDEIKIVEEKLSQGIFKEKNKAIISLFSKYISALKDQNLADGISLVRRAIENKCTLEQEIVCLAEFPLTPLEEKFAETVSCGNCRKMSISVLYLEDRTMPEKVTVRNCYGATNEVETIIDDIYRGKSLDQCTVAVTDTSAYSQLFFDYAVRYDIPVTFGCGIPVSNSNPAALLKLYNNWTTKEFFGAEALAKMLSDSSFDRSVFKDELPETVNFKWDDLVDTIGALRMTNDRIQNEERVKSYIQAVNEEEKELGSRYAGDVNKKSVLIPFVKVAARELSLAPEEFLRKYSRIRKGNATYTESLVMTLDRSALSSICDQIRTVRSAGQSVSDVINDLLGMNVCQQSSTGGALHITDIKGAFQNLRKNLYIAGMAASKYPGSPTENYLILDSDYELFGEAASRMTSGEKIKRKTENFNDLILFAGGLDCSVTVSYPGMNVSELKKDNASSVIYDLLRKIHGSSISWDDMNAKIEKTGYFDPSVSSVREIGKAYNEEKYISADKFKERAPEFAETENILDQEYSPSALLTFFECRKKFMFAYVLGIDEPEEYKNFEALSAKDKGTIAHQLMERLADKPDMPLTDFTRLAEEYFDRYIMQHPSIIKKSAESEKADLIEMMEKAYNSDPRNEVLIKEEKLSCIHESGIKLGGYPDRVEKLPDGSCIVVDFKTGNKVKNNPDDFESCIQVAVYSYLLEKAGYKVKEGQYRYISADETVRCIYDNEMKDALSASLKLFRIVLENGEFECTGDEDACKFCGYSKICGKITEGDE